MKYSKEFKLECIRKFKNGEYIKDPKDCKHRTFHNLLIEWVKIYDKLGEAGLDHKKPMLTLSDKQTLIQRIENGESIASVGISVGRHTDLISKWYKIYLQEGIDGLKSKKKGRPPKLKKESKQEEKVLTQEEQIKKLQEELEMAKLENEYLKKLAALVQKRKDQQQKKK